MEKDNATDAARLHELCKDRIAFFMKKLRKQGVGVYLSLEYELFFEDAKGEAMRVDEQKLDAILKANLPSYLRSHLDLADTLESWKASDLIGPKHCVARASSWGRDFMPVLLWNVAAALGLKKTLINRYGRQHEIELSTAKPVQDAADIFRLMDNAGRIPALMEKHKESLGHTHLQLAAKPYVFSHGFCTAPSQHVNVSAWDAASGRNKYANMDDTRWHKGWHAAATMAVLLRESGLLLYSRDKDFTRYRKGFMAPRRVDFNGGKDTSSAVCYRRDEDDPGYAHIENRAFSAAEDPYLTIMLSLAALYITECRKEHREMVGASPYAQYPIIPPSADVARKRLHSSAILKEALGEELFSALRREAEKGRLQDEQSPPRPPSSYEYIVSQFEDDLRERFLPKSLRR